MIYKLKELIKGNKLFYKTYFYSMSFVVNFIKLFVTPDDKVMLFVCFGGRHYSDSPKAIFEYLKKDKRFKGYKYIWAFVNPEQYNIEGADKIEIDTLKYYLTALKARVWITNVVVERALYFTGKHTFYLCTSHGIPLKGKRKEGKAFQVSYPCLYDIIMAQSEIDIKIQQEEFNITADKIALTGYPRNDKFAGDISIYEKKIRHFYEIPENKKILLYAPTFRDWNKGAEHLPFNILKWEKVLSNDYVLLFRAHPSVVFEDGIENNFFFKNATKYEDLDELLMAADVLISDYSSLFFDYSIMHKPMICWAYDYSEFSKYRKLRVDIPHEVYGGEITEGQLLKILKQSDFEESIQRTVDFQKKYVTLYGSASKAAADIIYEKIK